jgi:uncharacterized protein (TIGR00251 family)
MGCEIVVRLTPRAARDEITGWEGAVLRVRVTAPPVEGRANQALVKLLAKALSVPKGSVRIAGGERARDKRVAIEGLDAGTVRSRLG